MRDNLDSEQVGYQLLEELVPLQTFLCSDALGNVVVLKKLEEDCLHRGRLHPSVKDRLARVRELAHPHVATLRSVEQWEGAIFLVWTYLDGKTWDASLENTSADLYNLCAALATSVAMLHELGIVHGAIHDQNVILRPGGQVGLTQVSPYLYTDPAVDIAAVARLIRHATKNSPGSSRLLADLKSGRIGLREFSNRLRLIENEPGAEVIGVKKDRNYQLSSLLLAACAMAGAIGAWILVNREMTPSPIPPPIFPSLLRNNPH